MLSFKVIEFLIERPLIASRNPAEIMKHNIIVENIISRDTGFNAIRISVRVVYLRRK